MSKSAYLGYVAAIVTYLTTWLGSVAAYIYHFAFTVSNASSVEYSGYLFYLVAGILFPPLGVFNGLFLWFG